jgi:EAL and modified HD-GYP domain-containing signal transduction protein
MDVFVARQPIFAADKKVFAYELLFRTGMTNAFPNIDGGVATSSLLSSTFFTVGIEKIARNKKVFINFTEELLLRGTPELFSPEQVVVEILETVNPTDAVVAACQTLRQRGYSLALDDFVYHHDFAPLIAMAEIIKIDFRLTPKDEIATMLETLNKYQCLFLAEKIETYEEFQAAKAMGFSYFQGYFFAKPEVLKNRDISSSQLTVMQLLVEVNKAEFNIKKLEALVNQDVAISYKLINYLNSAYFARMQPLSSIQQAIVFLGERGFRMFVSLIIASRLIGNKPDELLRSSAVRAKFLETLGDKMGMDTGEMFLLGLFSQLDALLDTPMERLVEQLPLTADIQEALARKTGRLAPFLCLAEDFERSHWPAIESQLAALSLSGETVQNCYLEALKMADIL